MVGALLTVAMLVVVVVITQRVVRSRSDTLLRLMVAGYLLRIVIHAVLRDLPLFSHGGGGDYIVYEERAHAILRLWSFSGFEFVSSDDLAVVGETSLPPNLFAFVFTLNGGETTTFGCTAIIAAMACLTCLNLYKLGLEMGAAERPAMTLMGVLLFSPAFLLYSSDMFKDGIVLFFATGALASAVRLGRRFSLLHLILGGLSLWALWYVRFYLVFVSTAPLVVGLAGLRSRSAVRPLIAVLLMAAAFVVVGSTTDVLDSVTESANSTFEQGTRSNVLEANAGSGSGVTFDDGGNPWGAIGPKLAYMVFSPFPWASGSVGFHIGKLDTFLWYFILWRTTKAARTMWRADRSALLMLLTFIVPMTVAYAATFANVGLSLRQRLVIVMVTSVLAMQSWPRSSRLRASAVAEPSRPERSRLAPLPVSTRA